MNPRTIKCARCGSETVARGPSQKYCPTCAYQERLERQAAKREESKRELMKARAALFRDALEAARTSGTNPPKRKTKHIRCAKCDDCRKYDDKFMSRMLKEPTQKEIDREMRQRKIDEIQRAAHAAGMSYGKYKAMMEMRKAKKGA